MEDKISGTIENTVVETEADFIDPSRHKPPDAEYANKVGMTFLIERELNGATYRADIFERAHKDDEEREQSSREPWRWIASLSDGVKNSYGNAQ